MGKTANCIKMLEILNASGKKLSIDELAIRLETNKRNIPEYKKELNEIRPNLILSEQGKNGGYFINSNILLKGELNKEELNSLREMYNYITPDVNFTYKRNALSALEKILADLKLDNDKADFDIDGNTKYINDIDMIKFDQYPLSKSSEEISSYYQTIIQAIIQKRKVKINYSGVSKDIEVVVHPYKVFRYDNWHFIVFDEAAGDFKVYKMYRINKIDLLDDDFEIDPYYDERKILNKDGLIDDGKEYNVEMKVPKHQARILSERVYGKLQDIVKINKDTYLFKATMKNKRLIKKFILSLGRECQLLEPSEIKDEMKLEVQHMINNLNKENS